MRCYFIPTRMAIMEKTYNDKVGEDMEKLKPSYTTNGNVAKRAVAMENDLADLQTIKHRVTIQSKNSHPRYMFKRKENMCPHKNL